MRVGVALVAVCAAANVALGAILGFHQPSRADDLMLVYDWCHDWLVHGRALYAVHNSITDYPPNAIVFLAPITAIPQQWLILVWTVVAAAASWMLPCVVARATNRHAPLARVLTASLLFLCWACVRNFLQFGVLSLTVAFVAVVFADSRPRASGVALGLALIKLHVAGPIALWALIERRVHVTVTAAAVVAGGLAVYCLRVHMTLRGTLWNYFGVLGRYYLGLDAWDGRTSLRPWIVSLAGPRWGDVAWMVTAALLLLIPCAMAVADRDQVEPRRAAAVRALLCLWALLSVFQLAYNFVLFLPAFMFLILVEDPPTRRQRYVAAGVLQVALTFDLPIRASFLPAGLPHTVVANLDRILAVTMFTYVAYLWVRLAPARTFGVSVAAATARWRRTPAVAVALEDLALP